MLKQIRTAYAMIKMIAKDARGQDPIHNPHELLFQIWVIIILDDVVCKPVCRMDGVIEMA